MSNLITFMGLLIVLLEKCPFKTADKLNLTSVKDSKGSYDRIVGGEPVESIELYPFMVSVQKHSAIGYTHCGGSIIALRWVLTAAHCLCHQGTQKLMSSYDLVAVVGTLMYSELRSKNIYDVRSLWKHEKYSVSNSFNDIGLMHLMRDLKYNDQVKAVKLPTKEMFNNNKEPYDLYKTAEVLGYGSMSFHSLSEKNLRIVTVPIISLSECIRILIRGITENHICTLDPREGKDACLGDSGGPLVSDNVQIGIVSWGIGCGSTQIPAAYTRVDKYLDWINETMINSSNTLIVFNILFLIHFFIM